MSPLSNRIITHVAKKDYKAFEAELNKEVESKLKTHLTGFTNYLEKNTFVNKEEQ